MGKTHRSLSNRQKMNLTQYYYKYTQYSQTTESECIYIDRFPTAIPEEGKLITDMAHDSHTALYTTIQLDTKGGPKALKAKIEPDAQVNSIPLSQYKNIFPYKVDKLGNPKRKALWQPSKTCLNYD